MKKTMMHALTVLLLAGTLATSGCFSEQFLVGKGAQTGDIEQTRSWYVLWGLVPIYEADVEYMADGAEDYTIDTEFSFVDVIIGVFTGIISVYPKTVTVTK